MNVTDGEWCVVQASISIIANGEPCVCVATINDELPAKITKIIAVCGLVKDMEAHDYILANAALLASSKHLLEALIDVQEELNTSKKTINLEAVNETISEAVEKIAAESEA